ncbi:hypothetical protein [Treponema succinifaciens]|uniref:hypothetical protein n=1 Tax=Treponema succinifaciens TaxID=167 RepID=UPI0023523D63|nr:hypothetical protein [Treponema succinifaciens]
MKKIKYPKNWKETYWNIFTDSQKKELKNQWIKLHNKYNFLLYFSNNIKDIITGDFEFITDYFFLFNNIISNISEETKENFFSDLSNLFNYDKYRDAIAKYFYTRITEMEIYSCFYCDIHTIGKYELEEDNSKIKEYRTFDVDLFFENAQCPLLALSLKNFVPSCQICNSRVKGKRDFFEFYGFNNNFTTDQIKTILLYISPTSEVGIFDDNINIKVLPKIDFSKKIGFLENIENYEIKISSSNIYKHHIDSFRLNERYNSITILSEALSIMDLKLKYPLTKIKELKNQLTNIHISEEQIEEIIFRKKYDENRHSNLLKLKKDLLD